MSQGGNRIKRRNGSEIGKSYSSSLESSHSKDDSTSEITTVSYPSGDQKIRHKNYHNSKNVHPRKSHLVLRKDTNSNDSGFRKNSDYSNKHKTRHHHHHEDHILTYKNSRTEKPNCHKIVDCERNKRRGDSSRKEKSRILENECRRRYSSIEVNAFSDKTSRCNRFHSEKNKKNYFKRWNRIKGKENDGVPEFGNLDYNEVKNVSIFSQDEKKDKIEDSIEGSARTRFFYFKIEEGIKNGKKVNQNLNIDCHDIRKSTKKTKCQPAKRSKSESGIKNKSQLRKVKSAENSSKKFFDSKVDKTKKTRKIDIKETKIADAKQEVLKSISNPTIESLFESKKSQGPSRKSSKGRQKKCKIEGKKISNINLNSENSEVKVEDKKLRKFQKIKKNQKRKGSRYKNSRPEFKRKTLRYLVYLIRRIILSNREDNKNEDRDNKIKISKESSCIRIKQENKIESGCESSGYASLKNIEDRLSEMNKNENSETSFSNYLESAYLKNSPNEIDQEPIRAPVKLADECSSALTSGEPLLNQRQTCARTARMRVAFRPPPCQDSGSPHMRAEQRSSGKFTEAPIRSLEIEFLDKNKYCIYKIYKSTDGGILLKESQSQELKEGEYVIGRRILKEPETLLPFSNNTTSEKKVNQLLLQRNNSTQTDIDLTSKQSSKKKSWFRKSYTKKCQRRSKKNFASLESTSNSSFPESSDFEQFNLPSRKTKKIYSPSKKYLSNLPKPSAPLLKKSTAVDTSDLINFSSLQNVEDKMVILFNNSENEKNLGYLNSKRENTATSLYDETKLLFNAESIKSGENFSSVPPIIPVSWLKLDTSELIAQKINMEEMIRVQMENNCNFIQSTEFQMTKSELINPEGSSQDIRLRKEKKSSRNFFRIFKRKKKYN